MDMTLDLKELKAVIKGFGNRDHCIVPLNVGKVKRLIYLAEIGLSIEKKKNKTEIKDLASVWMGEK